jgi:nitrite reductase (NADH) large subunit
MKHIVIVGNSAAGVSAAGAIREQDSAIKITIISEEPYYPYFRFQIADMLTKNKKPEEIIFKSEEFYSQAGINILLNTKAEKIIAAKNIVVLSDRSKIEYDALIVASGLNANVPKVIKGSGKHGVLGFRSIKDIKDITELIPISHSICVWGGGIAGLRAALAFRKNKLEVKVISEKDQILPGVLSKEEAGTLAERFTRAGVDVIFNRTITEIFGNGDVKAIKLDSGKVLGCDILIVDSNLKPNTKFLEDSDIRIDKGVLVDEFLRSNIENIFAAGDVVKNANGSDEIYDCANSWGRALGQGKTAGINAALSVVSKNENMLVYNKNIEEKKITFFDLPQLQASDENRKSQVQEQIYKVKDSEINDT